MELYFKWKFIKEFIGDIISFSPIILLFVLIMVIYIKNTVEEKKNGKSQRKKK